MADAVVQKNDASISMPAIFRYPNPRVQRMCAECEREMERQEETGNEQGDEKLQRQAVQERHPRAAKWRMRLARCRAVDSRSPSRCALISSRASITTSGTCGYTRMVMRRGLRDQSAPWLSRSDQTLYLGPEGIRRSQARGNGFWRTSSCMSCNKPALNTSQPGFCEGCQQKELSV